MGESSSAWDAAGVVQKKRGRKRRVLAVVAVVLVLLAVLVAFAPTIASPIARGLVASKGSEAIPGSVGARKLSLSWFGPQRVDGLTLLDPAGELVADVDVVVEAGLLGLAFGSRDLGTITVSGRMDLAEDSSGELNLLRAVASDEPAADAGGDGGGVPPSLHAVLVLDRLDVSYAGAALDDKGVSTLTAGAIDGRVEIRPGSPVVASFESALGGVDAAGKSFRSGSMSASATITGLIAADGTIDPAQATVEATVKTEDLEPSLADRLFAAPVDFAGAFGSRVNASIEASGRLAAPGARFELTSLHVNANGAVSLGDGVLETTEAIVATVSREALEAVDPAWLGEVTGGSLEMHAMPSVSLRIDGVRVPMEGASLARAGANALLTLGALDATVSVGEGEDRTTRRVTTTPAQLTIGSESLASGVRAEGSMAFRIDGQDAGTLAIDVAASNLLSEAGRFRTDALPVLSGTLGLAGVDTGVLQPFVAASGMNLATEIGPSLSVGVELEPQAGGAITLIAGRVASENVNGSLNLALEETRLNAGDPGGQIRIASIGPLLSRLFEAQGLSVREGARVEMTLLTLGVDLGGAMSGGTVSVSDVQASGEMILGPTSGLVTVEGEPRPFTVEQVGVSFELAGPTGAVQFRMVTGGTFDGRPAGQAAVEMRASGVIGAGGVIGLPSVVAGRAEFIGVSTAIAEAFVPEGGPSPTEVVGPMLDLVISASPVSGGKTKLITSLTSELLTADGAFLFSERAFEVDPEEGFTLVHAGLGAALANMVRTGEGTTLRPAGATAEVGISRLSVPLDPDTRAMQLGSLDLAARLEVRNVFLDAGGALGGDAVEIRSLVVNPRVRPGEAAEVRTRTTVYAGSAKMEGEGAFTAPGVSAALGGTGGWDLGSLSPRGELIFAEVPAALIARGLGMANLEGLDTEAIAQDIAGAAFGVRLGLAPEGTATRATISAKGDRLTLDAHAVMAETLREAGADAEIRLSQPSTTSLLRVALPEMAETVSVVGATAFRGSGRLDKSGVVSAEVRIPAMTLRGIDADDLRMSLEGSIGGWRTGESASQGGPPTTLKMTASVDHAATRAQLARVSADLSRSADAAMGGTVGAQGLRMAWVDRLLGTTDLYTGLLGEQVGFTGDLAQDGSRTTLTASIEAPTLRDTTPLAMTMDGGSVVLDKPFRTIWSGDRAWLNGRLSRTMGEHAPVFDSDVDVDLRLRGLALPGAAGSGGPFAVDMIARLDRVDMTMPGGAGRAYRQVQVVVRDAENATGVQLVARGDVRLDGAEPVRAIDLTADVHKLVEGGALTPDQAYADVTGRIEHVPTSLVDALAGGNGWLTRMLGDEVSVDRLEVRRAPLEGGTVAIDLSSPASSAKVSGSFRDDKADGALVDGFFVLDQGGFIELTRFEESFTKDLFDVVPIFGEFKRSPDADRPSRIEIRSGRVPMSGEIERLSFDAIADLGSVRYGLSGPIEGVLKRTGQNSFGQLGGRIQPFDVRMAQGVVSYDRLTVPLGEFSFSSRGDIDIVRRLKDLVVQMPLGAFVTEALNLTGPLAGVLDQAAVVPMANKGPLEAKQWSPDFSKAVKPGRLLDDAVREGLRDILKPRGTPDGGG